MLENLFVCFESGHQSVQNVHSAASSSLFAGVDDVRLRFTDMSASRRLMQRASFMRDNKALL